MDISKFGCTIFVVFSFHELPRHCGKFAETVKLPAAVRRHELGGTGKFEGQGKELKMFLANRPGPVEDEMFPNGVIHYHAGHPHDGQEAVAQPCCSPFTQALFTVQNSGWTSAQTVSATESS